MNNRAVLLVNLGSPDAPDVPAVRRYLNQFLMDPYVIQLPWLLRAMIVKLFILPLRPKATAEAYQKVWTDHGAPLVSLSNDLLLALQDKLDIPAAIAMRYGSPDIGSELHKLAQIDGVDEILFIPLYPHYAESTVTTAVREAERIIDKFRLPVRLTTVAPFYDNAEYIDALIDRSLPLLEKMSDSDHLVFSYHGLPESHITGADPTGDHCLQHPDCCSTPSPAHATCYRHQVFRTTQRFVERAGLHPDQYSVAFQSRLGRAKWLEPSTEDTLVMLARQDVKNVYVMCPAFVTDCLETLEEIEYQARDTFLEAGGESLTYIPCLNDHPSWVRCLQKWIEGRGAQPAE